MAFRRPGIQILSRDAGGAPTVVAAVPFSERVVSTEQGPEFLKAFVRRPRGERFSLQGREVEPAEDEPQPIRDRPAPIARVFQPLPVDPGRHLVADENQFRPIEVELAEDEVSPIRDRPAPVERLVTLPVENLGDGGVESSFPLGEQPFAGETMEEKEIDIDSTKLPNGLAAGIGEKSIAGGAGGGTGGSGGSGSGGSVTVDVEPPPVRPLAKAASIGKLVMVGGALLVGGLVFVRVRAKR